jgi:hypothetical protein
MECGEQFKARWEQTRIAKLEQCRFSKLTKPVGKPVKST